MTAKGEAQSTVHIDKFLNNLVRVELFVCLCVTEEIPITHCEKNCFKIVSVSIF